MIRVLHISTECYPPAKAGGMGDVVGALPKYAFNVGIEASVLIPKYSNEWFFKHSFTKVFKGALVQDGTSIPFSIERQVPKDMTFDEEGNASINELGFPFYCIDIPGLFDRASIYLDDDGEGFRDEVDRNFAFQQAALIWLSFKNEFDIIHCHDHQVGLIPFFMKHGIGFESLSHIPTFYTIHNAAYKGMWTWNNKSKLPAYYEEHGGLLDWDGHIHSYASALRCSGAFNAVSEEYLKEISADSGNMNWLFEIAGDRSYGILNGIDEDSWNPRTDNLLKHHMTRSWARFKMKSKTDFCNKHNLDAEAPLVGFIGRLAHQKGADLIPPSIEMLVQKKVKMTFVILGSGSHKLEEQIRKVEIKYPDNVKALIMYNEEIAHRIYAATDFLVMPSRFEPCGLNQMFAMRYGSVPIVRSTGGLKDSVEDFEQNGTGIRFEKAAVVDLCLALIRAHKLYHQTELFRTVRNRGVRQDFSWKKSMKKYKSAYIKLLKN